MSDETQNRELPKSIAEPQHSKHQPAKILRMPPAHARASVARAKDRDKTRQSKYAMVYQLPPLKRIALIKRGIPATDVAKIAKSLGQPKERLMKLLGLPRATVDRYAKAKELLSVEHTERILGLTNLIGQIEVMVAESGDPREFDAALWLGEWLERPVPALGGHRPAEFMDTAEGQRLVASVIEKMQTGAYA